MNIILGCAQFGQAYGISGNNALVSVAEMSEIISQAKERGIDTFDTASAYGNCQLLLGEHAEGFKFISKIMVPPDTSLDDIFGLLINGTERSCAQLNVSHLEGLLIHGVSGLTSRHIFECLYSLRRIFDLGLIRKYGFSVYDISEVAPISDEKFDILQAPVNIFDWRLIKSPVTEALIKNDVEIHARSIFLQGLLLMPPSILPRYFDPWAAKLAGLYRLSQRLRTSPLSVCVSYVRALKDISKIVVGVHTAAQLREVLEVVNSPLDLENLESFETHDRQLIDPYLWRLD